MKKLLILLLLVLSLSLMLTGCNKGKGDDQPDTPPAQKTVYTVTWATNDGETIATTSVDEGQIPSYTYTVTDTAEWDYTFEGWAATANGSVLSTLPAANANTTYFAQISAIKQKYTVTFNTGEGTAVSPQTVEYGETVAEPSAPTFSGHRFAGWSATSDGKTPVDFTAAIKENATYYAIWNEAVDVKGLLVALLDGYELNPFSFLPESMLWSYSDNLVDAEDVVSGYSSFVNISDVTYGFGEQWQMVLDNLKQSMTFFNVLSVVDSLASTSVTAFNNYFDNNPSDTAHHSFASGIYNVTVNFDGEVIAYALDYTADIPLLGTQTVQIALAMDVESGERTARIQLGDANALAYTLLEDSYTFAIRYLGVRRAMFSVTRDDSGNVSGNIYEYLTAASIEYVSAADFYITEDYVSVVGNKANGIPGFTNTICELYDVSNGRMIGYEVQETLLSIVYNTLWFNLSDVSGITSFKLVEGTGEEKDKIYVNGSTSVWEAKKVGGLSAKMASRRFDIELRTQYVYSYDAATKEYTAHTVQVPMLFVQEENYSTLAADVKSTNNVTVAVKVSDDDLDKLLDDYDGYVPVFIQNKENITVDKILAYIGEKYTFN